MLLEPFLKCRRFRVEPDVFSELHVWNHLGTVFPRPVVDPGLRNIQVIGQVIHAPEIQSGLLLQCNLGRADRATSSSLSGEVRGTTSNISAAFSWVSKFTSSCFPPDFSPFFPALHVQSMSQAFLHDFAAADSLFLGVVFSRNANLAFWSAFSSAILLIRSFRKGTLQDMWAGNW